MASADCTSPTGKEGSLDFTGGTFKFCDGLDWISIYTDGTLTACTQSGGFQYDAAIPGFKFCNGTNWVRAKRPACTVTGLTYVTRVNDPTNLSGPSHMSVSKDGTKLYQMNQYNQKIAIYNINGGATPTLAGVSSAIAQIADGIGFHVVRGYAFVASRVSNSMSIVNVSNPAAISFVTNISAPNNEMNNIWGLDASPDGNTIFTNSWNSGPSSNKCYFHAIDITNPASPSIVGTLNLTDASGAARQYCNLTRVWGTTAYVSFGEGSIMTVDISDRTNPTFLNHIYRADTDKLDRFGVSDDGRYLFGSTYKTGNFVTYNVSNPSAITHVSTVTDATYYAYSYGTQVVGNVAIVTSEANDAVSVVNISNPAAPTRIASQTSATNLNGAAITANVGRYIYVGNYAATAISVLDMGCDPIVNTSLGTCTVAGRMEYFPNRKSMAYCDGSNYRLLLQTPRQH